MDISYSDDHEAFAGSRVNQYVYVPTKDTLFSALDYHADTLDGDIKPPLVILGDEGSGKTALFANWLARRREHRHRDEFLFQHFVGCSKESFQLSNMLLRLESALKDFFQLREMIVPETEVELRWSLGRFLAAAAKKYSPARIVIIIDGVNQLECEGAAIGALHWLPIDLPPCVRMMVSTVERNSGMLQNLPDAQIIGNEDYRSVQNSTYVELMRRGYPTLQMEPLGIPIRHSIVSEFFKLASKPVDGEPFVLAESQQYKIVTASATAHPLFLRAFLSSLKLAASMSLNITVDDLIEIFLPCTTAYELLEKSFDICFGTSDEGKDYLGKVLSAVYFSRNGLTENEIWGIVKMLTNSVPDEAVKSKIKFFLKTYTMVVAGLHSFSHAIYKDVVFARYIKSKGETKRWHYAMARYFNQLPTCNRKLEALPYHLGEAGSWSRVKNCLTDIEMFQLWWTPAFKKDFLKTWARLTARSDGKKKEIPEVGGNLGITEDFDEGDSKKKRPTYDVVEEYVKSLDEYRSLRTVKDEDVANIILQIADFLIEFAILGYEHAADVPASIHPVIPSDDLKQLGVPHVNIDEDGRSNLVYPNVFPLFYLSDEKTTSEAPMAIEDMPHCTTYFFHRWMWIQFPYIALGNCGQRYIDGINEKSEAAADVGYRRSTSDDQLSPGESPGKKPQTAAEARMVMSKSMGTDSFKLPTLKFNRKAPKTLPRVIHEKDNEPPPDKVALRLIKLQEDINNHRESCDFLVNMKSTLLKRVEELKKSLEDLKRAGETNNAFDADFASAQKRESDAVDKHKKVQIVHKNLSNLVMMCERHPPNVPALISEIELRIEQDVFLLKEIKNRLWEQRFERLTHNARFKEMKKLAKEGAFMHTKLLEYRYDMKKSLDEQAAEDERRLMDFSRSATGDNHNARSNKARGLNKQTAKRWGELDFVSGEVSSDDQSPEARARRWQELWSIISARTGITEPDIFFQRLQNSGALLEQINILKRNSELRVEQLKKEVISVETELEEVRLESSYTGGLSTKEKHKELAGKTQISRRAKERAETAEQLVQRVYSGFNHICELLGVPPREEGAPVIDIIRDVETVLDSLLEEREGQHQGQGEMRNESPSSTTKAVKDGALSPEVLHRPPELEAALQKFEGMRRRTAKLRLNSASSQGKHETGEVMNGGLVIKSGDSDEEDPESAFDDEGMWNRKYVKAQSQRNVRLKQREESKKSKKKLEDGR